MIYASGLWIELAGEKITPRIGPGHYGRDVPRLFTPATWPGGYHRRVRHSPRGRHALGSLSRRYEP
jgi:hypothetical protein